MNPAPPPMQTLMTPFGPISSGWAALKSFPNEAPISMMGSSANMEQGDNA